jgi:hypothetical protein
MIFLLEPLALPSPLLLVAVEIRLEQQQDPISSRNRVLLTRPKEDVPSIQVSLPHVHVYH